MDLLKFIKKTKPSHIVHFGSKNPAFGEKDDFYKTANATIYENMILLFEKNHAKLHV